VNPNLSEASQKKMSENISVYLGPQPFKMTIGQLRSQLMREHVPLGAFKMFHPAQPHVRNGLYGVTVLCNHLPRLLAD